MSLAGCSTPESICNDLKVAVNKMFDRCSIDARFMLVDEDGDERSCSEVTQIDDPNPILCECIPWTEEVECAYLLSGGERHPSCDEGQFRGPDF